MTRADQITAVLQQRDGLSDGQLSERIFGSTHRSTQINGECTYLQNKGVVARKRLGDGPILNFLVRAKPTLRLVMQDDPGVSHNEFGATQEEPTKETTFLNETSCATPSDEVFCKTHQQPKSALESDFEHAMYQIYRLADEECDYRPTYFLRMLAENGGVGEGDAPDRNMEFTSIG
jgi:hypothetical protein